VGSAWALAGLLLLRLRSGIGARLVVAAMAIVLAFWSYIGFEHVLENDAPLDIGLIRYLADETFLQGTSGQYRRPVVAGLLVLIAPVCAFWGTRGDAPLRSPRIGPTAAIFVASLVLARIWSPGLDELSWRRVHFLENAPARLHAVFVADSSPMRGDALAEPDPNPDPEVDAIFSARLVGERRTPVPDRPINVLVVMVEGLGGPYVPIIGEQHGFDNYPVVMSRLSQRAERSGLTFSTFINHQRQTDRGEYTLLCGDYPRLSSETSKMVDYERKSGRACLPDRLAEEGYHTAYLQSANLAFMLKRRFMREAGFDEMRGDEYFSQGYARSGWGIDDRGLYQGVLERLVAFEETGKPWFAAVLNIGTHHPYPVPDDFPIQADEDPHARAFRYVDFALDELIEGLTREGLADHTLVLVTSDEAHGLKGKEFLDITRMLSKNWGVMIALGPGIEAERVAAPYTQGDMALSVMDYLGLADPDGDFQGRSYFRVDDAPRYVGFANAFAGRQYLLEPEGALVACLESRDECAGYRLDPDRIFGNRVVSRDLAADEVTRLRRIVARSDVITVDQLDRPDSIRSFELTAHENGVAALEPRGERTIAHSDVKIRVGEGQRYHLDLQFRAIGDGAEIWVDNGLRTRGDRVLFQLGLDPLHDGDRITLRYSLVPKQTIPNLVLMFSAFAQNDAQDAALQIESAVARVETLAEGAPAAPGFEIAEFSLTTRDGIERELPYYQVGLETPKMRRDDCVRRTSAGFRAKGCSPGKLVSGPNAFAPAKSRLRATLQIRGLVGRATGRVEIRVEKRMTLIAQSGPFEIEPGSTERVVLDEVIDQSHRGARMLFVVGERDLVGEGDSVDFDIEALSFEILPDASQVRWATGEAGS
jgi:hypothetical protein